MSNSIQITSKFKNLNRRAFTLIELLVVMAIIVSLTALAIPAFNTIGGSQNVTSGGDIVAGNLDLARQTAMAENLRTELRFWNLPAQVGGASEWNAVQLFRVDSGEAMGNLQRLPQGVMIIESGTFSTLLGTDNPYSNSVNIQGAIRPYKAVRFGPDGSTELNPDGPGGTGTWTVTIVPSNSTPTTNRPADNFATVQVDSVTGRSVIYRP